MHSERRPRLTPAIADVRRAVRELLTDRPQQETADGLVLVGLSGGADSLALAAATAFEAPRLGLRAGAVIVDHALQAGSAEVAARAAEQARALGLAPVLVSRVDVVAAGAGNGPEAAARTARYAALEAARAETGATHVLLGHTLDDQAESVLLGLARGSGATSLHGMAPVTGMLLRPLLGIRRETTRQFCEDAGVTPWDDPHNFDQRFARVRVRTSVLPTLEGEIGPGIAEALARTAEQLREDASALDAMVLEMIEEICEPAEAGIAVSVRSLAANPPALRQRIVRYVVESEFGVSLARVHTLAVLRLVTDWHGQGTLDLPGVRVERQDGMLVFSAPGTSPSKGPLPSHGTSRH
ncbi:tRNA lysidine(34) synthetase TilS [Glaciibacter psychrotolerans]|uniref:tRNA(Ile)-lysidine synthase n=1 Tax=Glaciibacter psychrotolerans TaxID=670054 RepID=A0A7Z0J7L3_9MICO|nr:tRNA lysidine(34) synthetase TilS [Leifsonia psychrotolerans]NYJ21426.1 tRNA(Ile)-lysidine synthase [Leifsonia psychrotolerans]